VKFDRRDWKILALKVGKEAFLYVVLQFQMTLIAICGNFALYNLNLKVFIIELLIRLGPGPL